MIIAISRDFGAGATSVATLVSERCGYRLVNDDITWRVAQRLNLDLQIVNGEEEVKRSFLTRITEQLPGASLDPTSVPDEQETVALLQTRQAIEFEIQDEAQRGDVVIVGRAASFVLGPRPDLLRVFLHAPIDWRIVRVSEWFGYSQSFASETVKRLDLARAAYVRDHYGGSVSDARAYDLTIDTSTTGFENAAEAIISAVAMRYNPDA